MDKKIRADRRLLAADSLQLEGDIQAQSERAKTDIPHKRQPKEYGSCTNIRRNQL